MAAVQSSDILNEALMQMGGNQPLVTGQYPNFNAAGAGGVAAAAANVLYGPCVATVMRQFTFEFARHTVALVVTGNAAPYPWTIEYGYPADAIQIWNLFPAVDPDPNDPLPANYVIANAIVGGTQKRVIHTRLANALAVYNNMPAESLWAADFREAVVRLLASELMMAIAGKVDSAQALLQSGSSFGQIAEARHD